MDNYGFYANDLSYIKTVQLKGFRMFSLGEYPYVVRADEHYTIVAELFEIRNTETEQMICTMELDADYILSTVRIENTKFGIFLFENTAQIDQPVVHGDWSRYCQERAF